LRRKKKAVLFSSEDVKRLIASPSQPDHPRKCGQRNETLWNNVASRWYQRWVKRGDKRGGDEFPGMEPRISFRARLRESHRVGRFPAASWPNVKNDDVYYYAWRTTGTLNYLITTCPIGVPDGIPEKCFLDLSWTGCRQSHATTVRFVSPFKLSTLARWMCHEQLCRCIWFAAPSSGSCW